MHDAASWHQVHIHILKRWRKPLWTWTECKHSLLRHAFAFSQQVRGAVLAGPAPCSGDGASPHANKWS